MTETTPLAPKETAEVATPESTRGGSYYYTPRVDILETEDELTLFCEMPGVRPADLDLKFENGELTLYGKVQPRPQGAAHLLHEYGIGDFYRVFDIHEEIEVDRLNAELKQGVLIVHLPRKETVKPRKIQVKAD
jgi:HSP20 family protein